MNKPRISIKYPEHEAIKGEKGTVLIIGGSKEYTGAPYFTALSAFRTGAELVYILAQNEAILSIKTLLPEAVVMSIECREWMLKRVTACAIGPGLGLLDAETLKVIILIVDYLKDRNVPLVIDGDGLKYYSEKVFRDYKTLFLTPNINEKRKTRWIKKSHCLIEKGRVDIIRLEDEVVNITENGSGKRCGGQGDILVGVLCTFLSWVPGEKTNEYLLQCAESACRITRLASMHAFQEKWASLIASDIIEKLPMVMLHTKK